jgi:hypothetical protein
MPIEFQNHPVVQTTVSCRGDIRVRSFGPVDTNGVAWLVFSEGPPGEPGRPLDIESEELINLSKLDASVFVGANDVRSLDSIITVLTSLRKSLEEYNAGRENPPKSF